MALGTFRDDAYRDSVQLCDPLGDLLHVLLRGDALQVGVHDPPGTKEREHVESMGNKGASSIGDGKAGRH